MHTPNRGALAIDATGLTKDYGGTSILKGVDLQIAPGETYALLGPNGAGKSTTIEILEGVRRPTAGSVSVLGEDPLTAPRTWKASIGIVAQQTGDLGPYTPRELIGHFGALYPHPRGTDEVLDLVGLQSQAKTRASKLSGGQQRRLDVALGIVGRPTLLFLDEPTTGFDPEARRQFWSMLEGLTGEGTAILLTTHYLDEAAHLADRVGVLTGGTIVAEAPPARLGGAQARTPLVRWREPDGTLNEERTDEPGARVAALCAATRAGGIPEPADLEIRRPTLEEIYLGMLSAESQSESARVDAPAAAQQGDAS